MSTATISSKYQISIPAAARKSLGLAVGDKVEVSVTRSSIRITPIKPDILEALKIAQKHGDLAKLSKEMRADATAHVRKLRGLNGWK